MSRYRVKFTYTFPGTVLPPGDYLSTCVPGSVTRSPSEQPHQRSFSRARLHGRCRSHPLRQPECSGNSISPYPPTPPSLLAAMLRSIPGWRALHPGRHPICPPHFPHRRGGREGRRDEETIPLEPATEWRRRRRADDTRDAQELGPCRVCCIDVAMSQVSHSKTTLTWRTRPSSRPRWQKNSTAAASAAVP